MSKKNILDEFTNILAIALRHKIGSIVNPNEIYAEKYAKDSEILFKEAEKIKEQGNWNYKDKLEIKQELTRKLRNQLKQKDFLSDEKYAHIEDEINKALIRLELD